MTLDATVGGANSNSYATVEEADAYFASRLHASLWTEDLDKEAALITATQMLDWYTVWKGSAASTTQALAWPRVSVYDTYGNEVDDSIIPVPIKQAIFEIALESIAADRTTDSDLVGLKEVTAGPLTIKADTGYSRTQLTAIPDKVNMIIKGLVQVGGARVIRLVRG